MSKENYHCQCKLKRPHSHNSLLSFTSPVFYEYYTAYIPEKYAYKGNMIDIDMEDGLSMSWTVEEVGEPLLSVIVNERSQDYKRTRKASDI